MQLRIQLQLQLLNGTKKPAKPFRFLQVFVRMFKGATAAPQTTQILFLISAMCSGPMPQQPPSMLAPRCCQSLAHTR